MMIIKTKSYDEMSKKAAEILIEDIKKKKDIVLGFATGSTPLGLYKILAREYKKGKVDFSETVSFNLDEYYPIKKEDENSYYSYMFRNLFSQINIKKSSERTSGCSEMQKSASISDIKKSNINLLDGEAKNPEKECREYEKKLRKKRIDVQILGIGVNGHIAFNEPGSKRDSRTRLVELSNETIKANKINLKYALTMGIFDIMNARKIILLASGKNKAEAIKHLIECKEDKNWPVSFLRRHRNLVVIIDKEAGSLLR